MFEAIVTWLESLFGKQRNPMDTLGPKGENVAAKFLRNLGYRILERNFRCRAGEVDIIARDGKSLVFVEVKTRKDSDPEPEQQVNEEKMKQVTKVAEYYLGRFGIPQPPVRFDVVAVIWPRNQEPIIRHITDAFGETK
jgi:putative endonuclease